MEYQPELGTVLDLANDSNSEKCSLCSGALRLGLGIRHRIEGPFFSPFIFV